MHNIAIVIFVAGKDVKKKQDIFRGITNIKKPNKKKDNEAPLGNKNSRAQQLQGDKKEEKEKEKQGDKTNNYNTSFPVNESRILPDRPLTSKMASAIWLILLIDHYDFRHHKNDPY